MATGDKWQEPPGSVPIASNIPFSKEKVPPPALPRGWFATPLPIRRLFATFPLATLPENTLPASGGVTVSSNAAVSETPPLLYLFTTPEDCRHDGPSFNPSCLKWQTWLKLQGIETRTVPSNNHASPSGALPFLLPIQGTDGVAAKPVAAGKLYSWSISNGQRRAKAKALPADCKMREEAYMSLIEHKIRAGWLHALYLTTNFQSVVQPLYINSTSSALPVQLSISRSLKQAARESLHKLSPRTSPNPQSYISALSSLLSDSRPRDEAHILYKEAWKAFEALSVLLGSDNWFFAAEDPGMLDVSLFAYTHLLLDDDLGNGWADTRLRRGLIEWSNLVRHRKRLYKMCFKL